MAPSSLEGLSSRKKYKLPPKRRQPRFGFGFLFHSPVFSRDLPGSSREELQAASSSSGQHVVNIDELLASTEKKLRMLPPLSTNCIIYKVPDAMRKSNDQHFTPRIVSIGPIHYFWGYQRTNLKERYLKEFRQHSGVSLKECYKLILENESRLRNCYADVVKLGSEIFAEIVLMDAAFLIMILVYSSCTTMISYTDQLFRKPELITDIKYDMVLLENQLPFFILKELYKLSKLQSIVESKCRLNFNEETAMSVFAYEFLKKVMTPEVPERHPPSNPEHILDLYKSCLMPANRNPDKHGTEATNIPSVKKLYQAGVKIQQGCKQNMFDIRFNDGILKIPQVFIHDFTELVFRNLLAYELCHCTETQIFSDYFEMMRLLTLSSEDSELLIQNGVIINGLPNADRVSTLFQSIGTGNIIDWTQFLYSDVIKDLNEYYKLDWHKWKATLREKYFKAPWAACSLAAAIILLVLTIVQTIFTILQVVLHK